jgi:hypothetical protein
MAATLSHQMAGVGRFLHREFAAAWPVFLFFLIGFLLLTLLIKLALAQFSIEMTAVSNSFVGALIAAKAAIVLDETPLARALDNYRRIIAVLVKTFLYGAATLLMGYLERLLEALRRTHGLAAAFQYVVEHASHYRLFAWSMGISIVFALYFSVFEINRRMGEGALMALFFDSPPIPDIREQPWSSTSNRRI